jgi:Xaa-Pro aminopeptidase
MDGAGRGRRVARVTVAQRPIVPGTRYAERLNRALAATEAAGLAATLVGVGSDLRYLTGYEAIPLERLTLLVLRPGYDPVIVVPRLERGAAEAGLRTSIEMRTWEETEDPYALAVAGLPAVAHIAVSDTMLALHLLRIQAALEAASTFIPASTVLRDLRMIKDSDEVALLRAAAQAADRVVAAIAAGRLIGRTEADVAREVRDRLVHEGHDAATFAIVASGPNSASPHHEASERVIGPGEPIVLDIGGTVGGYGSDITRTLWVTGGDPANGPDEQFRHLFGVLHGAQAAATAAVRPGVACEAIDTGARRPIDAEGYGEAFFHRTGHGIGLDGHEDPYLIAGNDLPLRAGMAFSVEPGIYLPGRYGARIEDIVVCGDDGPIVLNEAPRELAVVDG